MARNVEDGECEHCSFVAHATVQRLTDGDDGPLSGFALGVQVTCSDCGCPFVFRGPLGVSPRQPTVSMDGLTLHAPLAPENDPAFGEDGIGLAIQFVSKHPEGVKQ